MVPTRTLHISTRSQWEDALNLLEELFSEEDIDSAHQQSIFIAFDEIISNVFNNNKEKDLIEIEVEFCINSSFISLIFNDNCKLFNPLDKKEKQEISFGGWGIDIVRKLMDEMEYKIIDGRNCLTIKKQIT